ncbi:hypothetical protein BDAP_001880 [Binucleata daphniae]
MAGNILADFKKVYETGTWFNEDEKDKPENEKYEYVFYKVTPDVIDINYQKVMLQDKFKPVKDKLKEKLTEHFKTMLSDDNKKLINKLYIDETDIFEKFKTEYFNEVAAINDEFFAPESFRNDPKKTYILEINFYSVLFELMNEKNKINIESIKHENVLKPIYFQN